MQFIKFLLNRCSQSGRGFLWLFLISGCGALWNAPGLTLPAQAVQFRINYVDGSSEGFNDPDLGAARRNAFQAAANKWGSLLQGNIPIVIEAEFNPLGGEANSATLGQAGAASVVKDWSTPAPPLSDTFYAIALANQLAGRDFNSSAPEIFAEFNSDVDNPAVLGSTSFYYGTDGRPGSDIDFYSTCLHEIGHGLGFFDLFNSDGTLLLSSPSAFDRFLTTVSSGNGPDLPNLPVLERRAALISNSLFFDGPQARSANGGTNAKMYAPSPYESGSSTSHLDESTYRGINELMTPLASGVAHDPGPVAFGIFRDIGWNSSGTPTPTPTPTATSGPIPTPSPSPQATATPTPTATATPIPTATPLPAPPNDNFANAQPIRNTISSTTGTNVNATRETGEPLHAGLSGNQSVWYAWTAPAFGPVTFETTDNNIDTMLAAYTGARVSALTLLASNDDFAGAVSGRSRITFTAQAGLVYYIAVDGFQNQQGTFRLTWNQSVVAPPNDNFNAPKLIGGPSGVTTGSNIRATREADEPDHGGTRVRQSVWFQWVAPTTGSYSFNTAGSTFDTQLAVYTGNSLNALTLVASNDNAFGVRTSAVVFNAVRDTRYRIAVDGNFGHQGTILLGWGIVPVNDNVSAASLLEGRSGRVQGNNAGATRETNETLHAGINGGKSVWYRWVAPTIGMLTLDTTGSNFDTLLAVYGVPLSGSPTASTLSRISANDNANLSVITSALTMRVVGGTTYYFAVDGKLGAQGIFYLNLSFIGSPPANDPFLRGQFITGDSGQVQGSTLDATVETGEPVPPTTAGVASVWYRWRAPASGRVTFHTGGSSFDTAIAAYTGTTLATLTPIASNNNFGGLITSRITFDVVVGTTYHIAVSAGRPGARGDFQLAWLLSRTSTSVVQQQVSTANASAATSLISLSFSTLLDGSAANAALFNVEINGVETSIEAVSLSSDRRTVLLALPDAALHLADRVNVRWQNLPDAAGNRGAGETQIHAR